MRVLVLSVLYWLLSAAVVGAAGVAQARDTVLLLQAELLRPDLCVALRIQLTDLADVRCLTRPSGRDLAARIADAAASVAREPARLAVLLERDPDPRYLRMILVGQPDDRAVLAVESIEDRAAPDVDRSLALKVRDTIEVLDASRAGAEAAGETHPRASLATVLAPPRTGSRAPSLAPWRGLLEVGGALGTSGAARGAGVVALGLRAGFRAGYGELALGAQLSSGLDERSAAGHVEEREWGLALALRAGREWSSFSLGALLELGVLRVHARGFTAVDDSQGEYARALARLGVGLDLRVVLLHAPTRVVLRLAPTLQVDPQRQRFELDEKRALDLGFVHAWLPLTLLFELPLQLSDGGDDA